MKLKWYLNMSFKRKLGLHFRNDGNSDMEILMWNTFLSSLELLTSFIYQNATLGGKNSNFLMGD